MADADEKWEDNITGEFYVDKECILCSLCVDVAPENFKEADDGDHDVVYKQPENDEERAACMDALEQCPVDAIGSDGA
ncbi:MAG: ferredoxin [Planctomycetota bacterium]